MNFIQKEGKTVDQAIEHACKELQITKENAFVKIIDEGVRGILGIGGKPAIVQVSEKFNIETSAEPFLKEFVKKIGLTVDYYVSNPEGNRIEVSFIGSDVKYLIGTRGATLNAIQEFLNLAFNKISGYRLNVQVDISGYREKRQETLEALAASVSKKVLESRKPYNLNAMSSFERKVIHNALQGIEHIETTSVGNEPNRYVVVKYVD